jgi:hypothetical protein
MSMSWISPNTLHRRWPLATTLALVALLALGATVAGAVITQQGNLRVTVTGKISPHTLPRHGTAPIAVSVGGQISTTDESTAPQLQQLKIEINRNGRLDSTGLPTCPRAQILNASNGRTLGACRSSLVGQGKFFGTINLPGSAPYPIEGKLLVFNGKEHGKQVLLGHIYSPHPFATSFVITFEISAARHGTYGTTLTANLAKALGSKRTLTGIEMTLSRRYSYRGQPRSYLSSDCPAPKGFSKAVFPLVRTSFSFANGRTLTSTLTSTCRARG